MESGLHESMVAQIDADASREKARLEYIFNLIDTNEDELRVVFAAHTVPEEEVPGLLYNEVAKTLGFLERECTRSSGINYRNMKYGSDGFDNQGVALGWAKYIPINLGKDPVVGKEHPHILRPTEKGFEIINGLRAVQGYVSLEEQAKINHDKSRL